MIKSKYILIINIILLISVISCNKNQNLNEEQLIIDTLELIKNDISDFPITYFISSKRSEFDFDWYNKRELGFSSKFSKKLRDSALNRIDWSLKDFNISKKIMEDKKTLTFLLYPKEM